MGKLPAHDLWRWWCRDKVSGDLAVCIAEVTNTPWGARVTFLFDPAGQSVPKAMHVSPFMDMASTWCALSFCCPHIVAPALPAGDTALLWLGHSIFRMGRKQKPADESALGRRQP